MDDCEVSSQDMQHGDELPFPEPDRVVITPTKEGAYQKELPTITFVYRGEVTSVQPMFLHAAENATIDDAADGMGLSLAAYFRPVDGDEVNFSQRRALSINVDEETAEAFLESAATAGRFVWVISCDDFKFRALINFETTEIIEALIENRFLH